MLVSDQAPYMLLTGKLLKGLYPNLKHVSCIVHAIKRVCLNLMEINTEVNDFIASFLSLFERASYMIGKYKEETGLPPPPKVTITNGELGLIL